MAFIPAFRIMRAGVIGDIPMDIPDDELALCLESPAKILTVHCFSRKINEGGEVKLVPFKTILTKFEGQALPKVVSFFKIRLPVLHPPRSNLLQLYRFGHISANCKGTLRCLRCGNNKHTINECPCLQQSLININCKGKHLPPANTYPTYTRQKHIYTLASMENISYLKARARVNGASSLLTADHHPTQRNFPFPLHRRDPRITPRHPIVRSPSAFSASPPFNSPNSYDLLTFLTDRDDESYNSPRFYAEATRASKATRRVSSENSEYAENNYSSYPGSSPRLHKSPFGSSTESEKQRYQRLQELYNSLLYAPNGRMQSCDSLPPLDLHTGTLHLHRNRLIQQATLSVHLPP